MPERTAPERPRGSLGTARTAAQILPPAGSPDTRPGKGAGRQHSAGQAHAGCHPGSTDQAATRANAEAQPSVPTESGIPPAQNAPGRNMRRRHHRQIRQTRQRKNRRAGLHQSQAVSPFRRTSRPVRRPAHRTVRQTNRQQPASTQLRRPGPQQNQPPRTPALHGQRSNSMPT